MMRHFLIATSVAVIMTTGVQAQSFSLYGTEQRDVTTSYDYGWLNDFSSARILFGGSVGYIGARNSSTVEVFGVSVGVFT